MLKTLEHKCLEKLFIILDEIFFRDKIAFEKLHFRKTQKRN